MPATTGISSSKRNDRMTRIENCLIILLLLALALPYPAWAQQRGLFLIQNPLQYVDLTYDYRNSSVDAKTGSSSSERHDLRPRYYLRFDYALYNPDVLQGTFAGSAKFDYSRSSSDPGTSSSKNGPGFELDVTGVFFDPKPLSADFTVRKRDDLVMPDFSPAYDVFTDYYKTGLRYKSKVMPVAANYYNITSRTSGLSNDSRTNNETVTLEVNHNYRQVSVSKASFRYNDMTNTYGQSTYDTHHSYTLFELSNTLAPTIGRFRPNFGSNLSYQRDTGSYRGNTYQMRETFSCYLGKALETGANYNFFRLERDIDTQTTNMGELWLEHQLFSSLRTRLSARANFDRYDNGYLDTYGGTLMTTYTKNLPDKGRLFFRIGDTYEVTDRYNAPTTDKLIMFDNSYTDVVLGNNIASVIRAVDSRDNTPYIENVDFTVTPGAITYVRVIAGSTLDQKLPTTVKFTVSYVATPPIKYGTNYVNVASSVSLNQDRYYLHVTYERRDQNLWSGQDNVLILGPSSFLRGGAELRLNNNLNTFGLEYQNLEYITDSRESVAGYWRYTGRLGTLAFNSNLQNTYAWYRSSQSAFSDNTLSAMVTVSKRLFRNSTLQLTSNYVMIRGDSPSRDDLTLRLRYIWAMGKFQLVLDEQSFLRFMSGSTQFSNLVKFEVRRYFW